MQLLKGGRVQSGQTCVFLDGQAETLWGQALGEATFVSYVETDKNSLKALLSATYATQDYPTLKYLNLQMHT